MNYYLFRHQSRSGPTFYQMGFHIYRPSPSGWTCSQLFVQNHHQTSFDSVFNYIFPFRNVFKNLVLKLIPRLNNWIRLRECFAPFAPFALFAQFCIFFSFRRTDCSWVPLLVLRVILTVLRAFFRGFLRAFLPITYYPAIRLLCCASRCSQLGLGFCSIFVCFNPFFLVLDSRHFSVSTF